MRSVPVSPLGQFFGSYLHQDWAMLYPTPWAAVESYVASEPRETRILARIELADLLFSDADEDELDREADRLGLAWYPPADGLTYRAWFGEVEQYLRDHEH